MSNLITIVGLGPGDPGMLSLAAVEALTSSKCVWLRTGVHPVVGWLEEKGVIFQTFDYIYSEAEDFQEVYRRIAHETISIAHSQDVLFAVPGHPLVAEESVVLISEKAAMEGLSIHLVPGMSFIDALLKAIKKNITVDGLHIIDGLRMDRQLPDPSVNNIVTQAYNRIILSEIKLTLMEYYPEEHMVTVVNAAGVPGEEQVENCLLYELDRVKKVNHLTSIYIPPLNSAKGMRGCCFPLDPLVNIMNRLREDNGCPWDREQDHRSLKKYLLEEAYEVIEAIDSQDMYNLCEELGDLLLQIIFHTRIASEKEKFNINDVVKNITEKMIRRHPHVFSNIRVKDSADVVLNWKSIKEKEKEGSGQKVLDYVPGHLPALMSAQKVQARAARVGFDWPDYRGAIEKVYEELSEVKEAIKSEGSVQKENEVGDLLFAAVNLSRLLEIDAEVALTSAIGKFLFRYRYIEKKALSTGRKLDECNLKEMDLWWEEAKRLKKV